MSNQAEPILDVEALVPTQETCARLTDAGFPLRTYFCWHVDIRNEWQIFCNGFDSIKPGPIPAPTAAELGEMLPDRIALEYHDGRVHPFWLQTEAEGHPKWGAFYVTKESQDVHAPFFRHCDLQTGAKTEAEARARLWLDLNSRGLLSENNTDR